MKKFTETYKNELKVVTEGLEPEVREAFKDIEGTTINECCGCCCGEPKCCEPSCAMSLGNACCCQDEKCFQIFFYTESEVLKKLETDATVQDLYKIRQQFNIGQPYRPLEVNQAIDNSPLFFTEKGYTNIEHGGVMQANMIQDNPNVLAIIKTLSKKFAITEPVVVQYLTGDAAVYGIKHTGTNGKEGSIKNSLLEMYNTLNSLQEMDEIGNASVCNVSIDSLDDVYAFLVRITLTKSFLNSLAQ